MTQPCNCHSWTLLCSRRCQAIQRNCHTIVSNSKLRIWKSILTIPAVWPHLRNAIRSCKVIICLGSHKFAAETVHTMLAAFICRKTPPLTKLNCIQVADLYAPPAALLSASTFLLTTSCFPSYQLSPSACYHSFWSYKDNQTVNKRLMAYQNPLSHTVTSHRKHTCAAKMQ
jgi:hypothetical protein